MLATLWLSGCDETDPLVATRVEFVGHPTGSVISMDALGSVRVAFMTVDGQVATTATGPIQVSLVPLSAGGTLFGAASAIAAGGIASFSDLRVDRAGTEYRLVAKAVGVDSAVSQPFSVVAGPASALRFAAPPADVLAGAVMPPVTVRVTDAGGNFVPAATPSITITPRATAGGALFGSTQRNATDGSAVFDDLRICRAGSYTLRAAAPGLTDGESSVFEVRAGQPTQLSFTVQPAGGTAGTTLPSFTVAATDACGNPPAIPPGGSLTVTISLGANPGGATLSGTLTRGGFAIGVQFTDVTIDRPGSGYTLVATMTGPPNFPPVTSAPFAISGPDPGR
jgi:hypothetical protein